MATVKTKNVFVEFWTNTKNYFAGLKDVKLSNMFDEWTLWEKSWLTISTIAILIASILTWDPTNLSASWTALISSITGMWCVILAAKGKISNYIFGFFNVILYAYAAYSWKLYGDFMLNAYYFLPMQFYGIYIWTKPDAMKTKDNVKSKGLSTTGKLGWLFIVMSSVMVYGKVLKSMGGVTPYFDATSTVLSVAAMILMARRYVEQWILWIVVDIVTVYMWVNIVFNEGGLVNLGILIMWVAWLINAVYGYINWIKMNKEK